MAAAVADYRASQPSDVKLKRVAGPQSIQFVANPDLLAEFGAARRPGGPILVGFALETARGDELAKLAQGKLESKRVDIVIANSASDAIGGDDTRAMLVSASGVESMEPMTKLALADRILDELAARWKAGS
jgi:phosphopantothenoylcysteine decarboxylase/phosphopantothenate--cysteine ligase